jgi:hypothetical protein
MQRVTELANAVPEIQRYRAHRRNRLKRTFVSAQDAVQAKIQKLDAPRKLGNEVQLCNEISGKKIESTTINVDEDWSEAEKLHFQQTTVEKEWFLEYMRSHKDDRFRSILKDVIYFELLDGSISKTISNMQKVGKLQMKFEAEQKKFFYVFDGQVIGEGSGVSKKTAKKLADENLVETLKANCYTIKSKLEFYPAEEIVKPKDQNIETVHTGKLQEDNIGFKMLKMLGWRGGSLGANNSGIIDPINSEIKIGRRGFGADNSDNFDAKHIRNLLKNFKENQVEYDLVFSSEFTKDERAQIHK